MREEAEAEQVDSGAAAFALVPSRSSMGGGTPRRSAAGAVPASDAVYLRHLSALLDEYLEDIVPPDNA